MSDYSKFTRVRNVGNVARKTFSDFGKKRSNGTPLRIGKIQENGAGTNVLPVTVNGCLSGISIPQQTGMGLRVPLYPPKVFPQPPPEEEEQQGYIKGKS